MDKTDKTDETKRFYWSDPPLGNVIETNKVGYVLEFYDHPGWDGNVGKIQISDVTSGFNNYVFTFVILFLTFSNPKVTLYERINFLPYKDLFENIINLI